MRKFWSVMVEYTVEAETEEQVWEKWSKEEDVTYEGIYSIEFDYEEEDD